MPDYHLLLLFGRDVSCRLLPQRPNQRSMLHEVLRLRWHLSFHQFLHKWEHGHRYLLNSLHPKAMSRYADLQLSGLCPGPDNFKCCLPASSSCGAPAVNAATIALIKKFEGFVASPSPDPVGLPTVGYGHLCQTKNCAEVPFSFPLTEAEASTLLNSDLKTYEACITKDIVSSVRLNDNQYGALCSWAFNEGCGAAGSSTLIARLNAGEDPDTVAAQELPKWDIAGGKVLQGLVNRRAAEVALFKTPSSVIAHPPPC